MPLKLACADFTFPLLSHEHVLQLIAMLEFKGVDIGLFEERSHLRPSTEFENVTQSARRLKSKLDAWGLEAADIFLQMGLDFKSHAVNHPEASQREKARDWFIKALDYAAECECKHVTGLPGAHFDTESYNDSFARAVDELKLASRSSQSTRHRLRCRSPHRIPRSTAGTSGEADAAGPRLDPDLRLRSLYANRFTGRGCGAVGQIREPLPRKRCAQ